MSRYLGRRLDKNCISLVRVMKETMEGMGDFRIVVNDTGKKNDAKKIGEDEKKH